MNPSPAAYSVQLLTPQGELALLLDTFVSLDAARTVGGDGALTLVLPAYALLPLTRSLGVRESAVAKELVDWWIVVQRRVWSAWRPLLQTAWIIREPGKAGIGGEKTYTLTALHACDLLKARQVRYYAGSAQASKSQAADDLIKAVVRENYVSASIAARNIAAAYLSVEIDRAAAPVISKDFAYQQVLSTIQAVCQASYTAGTALFYDLVPVNLSPLSLEFRTYANQRGRDLSGTPGLEFSPERGNLLDPAVVYDYTAEVNAVLAGGQGEGAARMTATSEDTARSGRSPWARREGFVDATQAATQAALQDDADAALAAGRPLTRFSGTAKDAPGSVFGEDWDIGDRVVARYDGDAFPCWLNTIGVKVEGGAETVTAKLSSV